MAVRDDRTECSYGHGLKKRPSSTGSFGSERTKALASFSSYAEASLLFLPLAWASVLPLAEQTGISK